MSDRSQSRRHIAQVVPFEVHAYSGLLSAVIGLSCALARRGNQVELWQLHQWREAESPAQLDILDSAGVERINMPIRGGRLHLDGAAKRAIHQRTVDVVHLHGVFSPQNNSLARCLQAPYLLSPHGGYAPPGLRHHRIRKAIFKQVFELPTLRRAGLVCALNEAEREDIRCFGFDGPVEVIPNGVDRPPPNIDASAFRRDLGLGQKCRLAVFVGRLDPYYKRLDDLIRSIAQVPAWHLALVGPEWKESGPYLRDLISRLNVENRVHLTGPRRNRSLHEALAGADLFVLVSRSEGLPIALLEALAHGVPALVSSAVERTIGVSTAGAGWVASPEELTGVLEGLLHVASSEWNRRRTGATALAAQFNWNDIAARYEQAVNRWFGAA